MRVRYSLRTIYHALKLFLRTSLLTQTYLLALEQGHVQDMQLDELGKIKNKDN